MRLLPLIGILLAQGIAMDSVRAESMHGKATYYWHSAKTANGEMFRPEGMTAAHRTLPFGTQVRVTHTRTKRSVVVRINDRGPFVRGITIDLSRGAAREIGMLVEGISPVEIQVMR
jgi:rare lipoprotein A